jgi:hypothetical protein
MKRTGNKDNPFKSFRLAVVTDNDGNTERRIELHTPRLLEYLRNNINLEDIYDDVPVVSIDELFNQFDVLKARAKRNDAKGITKELVSFLENENKNILGRIKNLLDCNQMSFGLCRTLFAEGTEIEIHGDHVQGGRVVGVQYQSGMWGTFLTISYQFITTDGANFQMSSGQVRIPYFKGVREINKLPIRPMTEESKAKLTARGELFRQIAVGAHYMSYHGMMYTKKWWSWDAMRADGRMMVDAGTYSQFVDEYGLRDNDETRFDELTDDQLWMTDPYIRGFSFSTKQWGKFIVDQISPVEFRNEAFDQLVLAQDKKDLVKALVTHGTNGFSDIISGKGGGCIFLLHGEPGVGKTLTAEAISELLHRPLYSVAVGELGTNTDELEKKLRQILDVAQIWNAVVLIDEADIFLEKRTSGDILRNAMVGIFLRLLEYHQGVLFLTTNRVTEFDSAFHSRISVALKYGKLTREAREKIWTNLLAAAQISGLDPAVLSETEINGRQIKTTIRLAQGLAKQQGVPVSADHISATLAVSQQFQRDLKEG